MKKYLKIILGIIAIVAIVIGGYFLWKNVIQEVVFPTEPETPTESTATNITPLTEDAIFDYWINQKNNGVYFLNAIGQAVRINNNQSTVVNSQTLGNLHSLQSSFDGAYAVAEFNYPQLPTFSIFNTATNNWQSLPANTRAAAWSPTAPELLYIEGSTLKILNLANQSSRTIATLAQKDVRLYWVNSDKIFFAYRSAADFDSSLWSLDIKTGIIAPINENLTGLMLRWYPKSEYGLQFHLQKNEPMLSLIDKNGIVLTAASFFTLPNKCLIEGNILYCGVPKFIPDDLRLPDDYQKKSAFFEDAINVINLEEGSVTDLTSGTNEIIDAEHLETHNNRLLFINRLDKRLYSIPTK